MKDLRLVSAKDVNGVQRKTEINIGDIAIGRDFLVIAGPCSVESEEQILSTAESVKNAGAKMIRGGTYKPRTSPYSFRGLGRTGLIYLKNAGDKVGLPVITEVIDTRDVYLISEYSDVLQIGARNMQNFSLLVEVGKAQKPVLLKRGMYSTIEEWLYSAEYIMHAGNPNVILCERGIRSVDTVQTRNTLDLGAVAAVKKLTHLPVIVDPSHATGRSDLVAPMSLSAILSGCDGLIIEVHPSPPDALSDSAQQLTPSEFEALMRDVEKTLKLRKSLEQYTQH
jgi:3-deoxy-7-phosphoheptulonate synthase